MGCIPTRKHASNAGVDVLDAKGVPFLFNLKISDMSDLDNVLALANVSSSNIKLGGLYPAISPFTKPGSDSNLFGCEARTNGDDAGRRDRPLPRDCCVALLDNLFVLVLLLLLFRLLFRLLPAVLGLPPALPLLCPARNGPAVEGR